MATDTSQQSTSGGGIDWGSLINAGVGLYGAYQQNQSTQRAATLAQNHPYSTYTPFGDVQFGNGTVTVNPNASPFGMLSDRLAATGLANYGETTQDPYQALPDQYRASGGALDSSLGGAQSTYGGLGNDFFGALRGIGIDPQAAATNRYNLLEAQAQPGEDRAVNSLKDTLFGSGRMGTTGGVEQAADFSNALSTARTGRQLAAQDFAMGQQRQLFDMGSAATDAGASRAMDRFNLAGNLLNTSDQRRQQQFTNAMGAEQGFQSMFNPLLQFANLGVTAGTGSPTAATLAANGNQQFYNTLGNTASQLTPAVIDAMRRSGSAPQQGTR